MSRLETVLTENVSNPKECEAVDKASSRTETEIANIAIAVESGVITRQNPFEDLSVGTDPSYL